MKANILHLVVFIASFFFIGCDMTPAKESEPEEPKPNYLTAEYELKKPRYALRIDSLPAKGDRPGTSWNTDALGDRIILGKWYVRDTTGLLWPIFRFKNTEPAFIHLAAWADDTLNSDKEDGFAFLGPGFPQGSIVDHSPFPGAKMKLALMDNVSIYIDDSTIEFKEY